MLLLWPVVAYFARNSPRCKRRETIQYIAGVCKWRWSIDNAWNALELLRPEWYLFTLVKVDMAQNCYLQMWKSFVIGYGKFLLFMPGPCSAFWFDINFGNKREETRLSSFEYNLLPNLISNQNALHGQGIRLHLAMLIYKLLSKLYFRGGI